MKKWIPMAVIGGIVLVLVIGTVTCRNSLVNQDAEVQRAWGQIGIALQRRSDLIPNLVESVKGFAAHEKEVIASVTEARAKLAGARSAEETVAADAQLTSALSRLLVVVENYPQLKANENFIRLQDELAGTENRISVERKRYNDAVGSYNAKVRRFPTNLVAGVFGFESKAYFEAAAGAEKVPQVKF
jgi:LemA protein